uniref:Uncharacterized protein n=1 Tax=Sinorhizobium meliloti (strain SM11) TaxID=707241 RepID=Q1WLJ7_SINMM|nr:hypothetical protein [Sinorhizobium meliloti]
MAKYVKRVRSCETRPLGAIFNTSGHPAVKSGWPTWYRGKPRALGGRPSEEETMVARMLYGADPFRNIRRFQDEVSRGAARALEFPAVNVFANQDGRVTWRKPCIRRKSASQAQERPCSSRSRPRQPKAPCRIHCFEIVLPQMLCTVSIRIVGTLRLVTT